MVLEPLKDRVVASATSLFSHAPYPLHDTMAYRGDAGLFGPASVTWEVVGDAAAFVGGIRALLVQSAHPEVLAGVTAHSRYRDDPLGRLSRTSAYVTATSYGAAPEVEAALSMVRRAHRGVAGTSWRGRTYAADDPAHAAWVHNVLVDSFLAAFAAYGPRPLEDAEADRFVAEQTRLGVRLGASPLPATAGDLRRWIVEHPDIASSREVAETVAFLRRPPLPRAVRPAYRLLYEAAAATIDPPLRDLLGVRVRPGSAAVGAAVVSALRWALGSSPSWFLALRRVGAPIPPGRFRPSRVRDLERR